LSANLAISIIVLLYASWSDYKTREVSNRVWIIYAPIAAALSIAELLLYEPASLLIFGLSVGFTVGLAFLLFYAGGFGGADSKALMCIAVSLPFAPLVLIRPLIADGVSPLSQVIYPLTIFGNAVLFAAVTCVYMVARNVYWHRKNHAAMFVGSLASESWGKKMLVLITGYKVPIAKLKEKWHVFPMEDVSDGEGEFKRHLMVVPHDEGRDKVVERLSNAAAAGRIDQKVWATPGLPMLIFVTLGLIAAVVFGDFVWLFVRLFLV
jgi:archaeal preflagellin peptidase FlaK